MENLNFKDVTYQQIERSQTPDKYSVKNNSIDIKAGHCLNNSYLISKKFTEVNMVEGFLITYFEDGTIESVGHVWNEIQGIYFDETVDLKKSEIKIVKNEYYLAETYTLSEAIVKKRQKTTNSLSSFFDEPKIENELFFKTRVKDLEIELKEFLNNKEERDI